MLENLENNESESGTAVKWVHDSTSTAKPGWRLTFFEGNDTEMDRLSKYARADKIMLWMKNHTGALVLNITN